MSKCTQILKNLLTLPNILVILSGFLLIAAISLAGASLSEAVKWNLYNSGTDYGVQGGTVYYMYAYQNLWTRYDLSTDDTNYIPAYGLLKNDSWRALPRFLVLAAIGSSGLAVVILILSCVIPICQRKIILLYISRGVASFLAIGGGGVLGYALFYYYQNYPSLHGVSYNDPTAMYPQEDNLSTGFFMAGISAILLIASAILDIISIMVIRRRSKILPEKKGTNQ